jgi:hypothetical protein
LEDEIQHIKFTTEVEIRAWSMMLTNGKTHGLINKSDSKSKVCANMHICMCVCVEYESSHNLFSLDSTILHTPTLTSTAGLIYNAASSFHFHPEDGGYNVCWKTETTST